MELLVLIAILVVALGNRSKMNEIKSSLSRLTVVVFAVCGTAIAEEAQVMHLSPEVRAYFKNPDGSCVQCSIGMAGANANDMNAASLLWDTVYGQAERGGSWPSRVEAYCDKRGIRTWSVSGNSVEDTMPWLAWAAKTGRFAAVGAGQAHFQTLYGYDPVRKRWYVCNNNSTSIVNEYTDEEFRALHAASGPWVVILEKPSSPPPDMSRRWK